MKAALTILTVVIIAALAGCNGTVESIKPLPEDRELLTVNFQEGQTLRYRFVSSREIVLDWGATESGPRAAKNVVNKSSESMDFVVAYTPVKVDPYGPTTIKATCESVKAKRTTRTGKRPQDTKDAVKSLAGKTFTFTVHPSGEIDDYSQLDELIKETGKKAFRARRDQGRIKEPDMISDFVATQWFLWDSVSSIEKPTDGVAVGQTWKSSLSLPTPMVMRKARDVSYTLDAIRPTQKGRLAVIRSSYSLAESVPRTWPVPYSGRFQVSGQFGLLKDFQILDLKGQGEELFNIDAGRIEQYNQQYKLQVGASLWIPLSGTNPKITIEQKLTMRLLGSPASQ